MPDKALTKHETRRPEIRITEPAVIAAVQEEQRRSGVNEPLTKTAARMIDRYLTLRSVPASGTAQN
jgi:hypothetical protein